MAFIEKNDPIVLNIKLTSKGRELLSQGKLDFKYYAIGDSEIDYNFNSEVELISPDYTGFNANILKPIDKNPNIMSFIRRNLSGDSYNYMSTTPTSYYTVNNSVESLGFFTNSGATYITDSNHVKQPDAMIKINTVDGGLTLNLLKSSTYGTSIEEPSVGDLLYVKWTMSVSSTGYSVNKEFPTPNLFYKITGVGSGKLSDGSISIDVDRKLPDFTDLGISDSVYAGAMIYHNQINYSGNSIVDMSPTEYVEESVISFSQNSQCSTAVFPFWNMSIVFTEEIAGVYDSNIKYTQFKNKSFGGFVSYIQNQSPIYKKLGIIHYSNPSPANVYAEGFLLNTSVLEIPTIMWHKSTDNVLGVKLIASGSSKLLTGSTKSLNILYYDLCDLTGFIVGKVFPELKIFVIEDQELLYAMSYKSNRSWTLPNYNIGS